MDFTNSWFGVIFNPIGYSAQHVSISTAVDDYAKSHPPRAGIDVDKETEESFVTDRQNWIDACTGAVKARDVGYSKANCADNCKGKFDQDAIAQDVKNAIAARAEAEKASIIQSNADNAKKLIAIVGAILLIIIIIIILKS